MANRPCKNCTHEEACKTANPDMVKKTYQCKHYKSTADVVEVKHGHFVRNERNIPKMKEFHKKGIATAMKATSIFYTCSCCNDWGTPIQKYCSGCGAKMNNVVNYESSKKIKNEER